MVMNDAKSIFDGLWIAWQPVVSLKDGSIYGHEALIRGVVGSAWEMPAALFAIARDHGLSEELEKTCRQLALQGAIELVSPNQRIFMNINNLWPDMPLGLPSAFVNNPHRLAIEISEGQPIIENDALLIAVRNWRDQGHAIVLDDYGSGYASAATVLAVSPDIIKLDRQLVANLDRDPARQSIISSIRDYTLDLGIGIVAEGIETQAELLALRALHIEWGQGFWLARPSPNPLIGPIILPPTSAPTELTHDAPTYGISLLDFYRQAIEASPIPSYLVDRRRTVIAWNAAAAELTGYESSRMVGQKCFDGTLLHQDQDGHILCFGACPLVWSMAKRHVQGPHRISFRKADGARLDVVTTVFPLWDTTRQRIVGALEQFIPSVLAEP